MILSKIRKREPRPTAKEQAILAKRALLDRRHRRAATPSGTPAPVTSLQDWVQAHPAAIVVAVGGLAFAAAYFRPTRVLLRQAFVIGTGILVRQAIARYTHNSS